MKKTVKRKDAAATPKRSPARPAVPRTAPQKGARTKPDAAKDRDTALTDVLVIGAGAAGSTIAGLLARNERRVLVLDRDPAESARFMPRWVSGMADDILKRLGVPPKKTSSEPVRAVAFHSGDLEKHQEVTVADHGAYFINMAVWNTAINEAAAHAGATIKRGTAVTMLRMKEDCVVAECSNGELQSARLLVVADGVYSRVAESIGLQLRPATPRRYAAQLDWPADKASKLPPGTLNFVLGIEGGHALATYWSAGGREVATVFALDDERARAHLDDLLERVVDVQGVVLPKDVDASKAFAHTLPAGHCLEIECHVGKRSLAIGDAGGFVASATCEGVYPAMWSADIAAEIIHRALERPHPQDELREYDTKWRTTMADYLRPPNADLQFLLPLVFANKQMAERLAGAFLRGENL